MYFGPEIEVSEVIELWHGQVWKESPMFGEISLLVDNSKFLNSYFIMLFFYNTIIKK